MLIDIVNKNIYNYKFNTAFTLYKYQTQHCLYMFPYILMNLSLRMCPAVKLQVESFIENAGKVGQKRYIFAKIQTRLHHSHYRLKMFLQLLCV